MVPCTPAADPLPAEPSRVALLPPVEVGDLDWDAIELCVKTPRVLQELPRIVQGLESIFDCTATPLLFDDHRTGADDQTIQVSAPPMPLWIIGDLHGDLLALESSLALIERESTNSTERPGIVLLGDLFDDEGLGLAVLLRVFDLILIAPDRTCLIAGNHDEALGFADGRFTSSVDPSDFADYLNAHLEDEWVRRAGELAVRLFASAPRALFFPDGLLAAHGGFPLSDLHQALFDSGNWNHPQALSDFVWARAHPKARKKLPNRYTRGSQFGYGDFAEFCMLAGAMGRPVSHMVRGHDHVDERYAVYAADRPNPILTTVALSRRLPRESFGPYERVPTLARYVEGALPQIYRLHIPPSLVRGVYPEPVEDTPVSDSSGEQSS